MLSEFDAERSELLLARAALLVESLTEKLVFPFVFAALGFDADQEGITIVQCDGKANIPSSRVCARRRRWAPSERSSSSPTSKASRTPGRLA